MSADRSLGYVFAPVPVWVFVLFADGTIGMLPFVILVVLFRLASGAALSSRQETPTLSLDRLVAATRYSGKPASLSRELCRMRDAGLLDYRVTGNAITGYRYVFQLYPDAPRVSDLRPTSAAESQSQDSRLRTAVSSDARPTSAPSRPTSNSPSNRQSVPDFALAGSDSRPTSLDVGDESKPLSEGAVEGKASSSRARTHTREAHEQAGTSDALDSNARINELIASTGRLLARSGLVGRPRPLVGDDGFGSYSRLAKRAGYLLASEHLDHLRLTRIVIESREPPIGEGAFVAALTEMFDATVVATTAAGGSQPTAEGGS